ncbi:MAG TPA: histidine kinase [Bryobacteraceae bacterium]|jgi:signal transduction histidine kinase|nr:histidine kinase [Bryobacteraceae bacterium]
MRPAISRTTLIKAGALFAIWTTYGSLSAWQTHYWYSFTKEPMSWPDSLRFEVSYGWLWLFATPLILWLARRFRIERNYWARNLAIHFLALTAINAITKTVFDAGMMPPNSAFREFTWPKLMRSIEQNFDTGTLLYFVIILVEHSVVYYRRYQQSLINAANLQTQLVQAQLRALKMQLHPHFLFNTLHTITALVHEDPELAERTIARLSELLRLFLANSTIHEVPLSEELRILDLYLEIERTRFEDRLSVHFDVPPELREAMVPNLVLQPLVENSIRHGVGRRSAPGWISVAAEKYGETLVLRVTDNGVGLRESGQKSTGMGLAITKGRLESLYGERQSLVLREVQTGGAEVRITLPFRRHVDPAQESREGENAALQSTDR